MDVYWLPLSGEIADCRNHTAHTPTHPAATSAFPACGGRDHRDRVRRPRAACSLKYWPPNSLGVGVNCLLHHIVHHPTRNGRRLLPQEEDQARLWQQDQRGLAGGVGVIHASPTETHASSPPSAAWCGWSGPINGHRCRRQGRVDAACEHRPPCRDPDCVGGPRLGTAVQPDEDELYARCRPVSHPITHPAQPQAAWSQAASSVPV